MTKAAVATLEERYNNLTKELEEIEEIIKSLYIELEQENRELEAVFSSGKSLKYEELEVDISSYEAEFEYKSKKAERLAAELNSITRVANE